MKGYTSIPFIENYLLTTIDVSFYSQINEWISQIEKYVDKITGRNFVADTSVSTKKYDGDGSNKLLIDDAILITKVEIGSDVNGWDEIDSADIYQYPTNTSPKTKIVIEGIFPKGYQNVRVTGKWGYTATVTDDVVLATTVLVSGIIN
jgi:hypothetical protein